MNLRFWIFEFRFSHFEIQFTVPNPHSNSTKIVTAAAILGILAAALGLAQCRGGPRSQPQRVPTEEEKAYLQQIVVSDARMSAVQNFLGDTVYSLDVRVKNNGARPVRRLELDLKFVDTLNQVVLRETGRPVTLSTPPLQPGESRAFRVSFDHMPADWNQAPPVITPTSAQF